jgi:hypothetical protein
LKLRTSSTFDFETNKAEAASPLITAMVTQINQENPTNDKVCKTAADMKSCYKGSDPKERHSVCQTCSF